MEERDNCVTSGQKLSTTMFLVSASGQLPNSDGHVSFWGWREPGHLMSATHEVALSELILLFIKIIVYKDWLKKCLKVDFFMVTCRTCISMFRPVSIKKYCKKLSTKLSNYKHNCIKWLSITDTTEEVHVQAGVKHTASPFRGLSRFRIVV